nr:hypothetical protein [Tanacetum cinerariifolium]
MIIIEFDCTQKFIYEVGELRAISSHVLGASGVQIPENNLDNLHSTIEEDGTLEIMDPQDIFGSFLSADNDLLILDLLTGTIFLDSLGCDPLALVGKFTPVEDSIGLLETTFDEDVVLMGANEATSIFSNSGSIGCKVIASSTTAFPLSFLKPVPFD